MIYLKLIKHETPEYKELVDLRHKHLREPLGLSFTEDELLQEKYDWLLGCFLPRTQKLIGGCVLTKIDEETVKLRQMAVEKTWRKHYIGKGILCGAETVAQNNGFKKIELHARKEAVDFYVKNNYQHAGEEFIEVGIPHFKMYKMLQENE